MNWKYDSATKFFVQQKSPDGEVGLSVNTEGQIVEMMGYRDCTGCEFEVYAADEFGEVVKLEYVPNVKAPYNRHVFINPNNGEVIIEGYSEEREMIDLRNYADLIRQLVKKEDEKDPNWKWSVKSIGKNKVRIRWGYLDYLGEKENCFVIEMQEDNTEYRQWMSALLPHGGIIEVFLVVEGTPNPNLGAEQTIQSGIECAIWEIAHYAHSRY